MSGIQIAFLIVGLTVCIGGQEVPGQKEYFAAVLRLQDLSNLDYNDLCNFQEEKKKEEIGLRMFEMLQNLNFSSLQSYANELNNLTPKSVQFCNSLQNLQCNSSGVCVCGSGQTAGITISSIRENGKCRLTSGSACGPQDTPDPGFGIKKADYQCESRSKCILKKDGIECNQANVQKDLLDSFGGPDKVRNDPKRFINHTKRKIKMAAEYCVCGGSFISWGSMNIVVVGISFLCYFF